MGTFSIMIGFGVLFLFILSDLAQQPDFDYLFLAGVLVGAGWLLRKNRPAPPASGRFSLLRRRRGRGEHEQDPDSQSFPED